MSPIALSEVTPGFADAVGGAQRSFRVLLEAMSRPGRVLPLSETALRGLVAPASQAAPEPMNPGTAALLLTLLDADTSFRLHGVLASTAARTWLRFHAGAHEASAGVDAAFAVVRAADVSEDLWPSLGCGSDDAPQLGATLLVEVPILSAGTASQSSSAQPATASVVHLQLRGPGIATTQRLAVGGVPRSLWRQRIAQEQAFPRGIELILVCGTRIAALPRSTRVTLED